MANPSGRLRCKVIISPEESVEQVSGKKSSTWTDVHVASTLAPSIGANFLSESIVFSDGGEEPFGYINGAPFYEWVTTTSRPLDNALINVEYIVFKHSGYKFNSIIDATCDTTNTDATVTCDSSNFIDIGMKVSGSGTVAGSSVASINTGTAGVDVTSFELSAAATATATDATLTFADHANLSTTANADDFIEIRATSAAGFVIAVLGPGESIVLPVRSSTGWPSEDRNGSADYYVQSVDPDDLTAGANDIAMQVFCATHS